VPRPPGSSSPPPWHCPLLRLASRNGTAELVARSVTRSYTSYELAGAEPVYHSPHGSQMPQISWTPRAASVSGPGSAAKRHFMYV